MFTAKQKVRMHDTDMAGILYFAKQFRFFHDTFEDLMALEGLDYNVLFNKLSFVFTIVHAEADYLKPLTVGDSLEVRVYTKHIGQSSFTVGYEVLREKDQALVGTGKTVHVTLDSEKRTKIPIPPELRKILVKYTHPDFPLT